MFRAAEDGTRTAARLAEAGHAAVLAPVLRIRHTGANVVAADADAVVFTSAHAPALLEPDPALLRLPCWCVGARTAAAAAARGFARVETGPGDADRLATAMREKLAPGTRLLLLVGRDRKPILEARLATAGFPVRVIELYWAEAVEAWDGPTCAALRDCAAALHYSGRSAGLAMNLAATHGLLPALQDWHHLCLSADIAEALRRGSMAHVHSAATPDEASLLAILATLPVIARSLKTPA